MTAVEIGPKPKQNKAHGKTNKSTWRTNKCKQHTMSHSERGNSRHIWWCYHHVPSWGDTAEHLAEVLTSVKFFQFKPHLASYITSSLFNYTSLTSHTYCKLQSQLSRQFNVNQPRKCQNATSCHMTQVKPKRTVLMSEDIYWSRPF